MALGQTSISRSFRRKGLPTGGVSAPTKPKPKSDATGVDYGVAKSPTHIIPQMPQIPQAPTTSFQPIPGPVMPVSGQAIAPTAVSAVPPTQAPVVASAVEPTRAAPGSEQEKQEWQYSVQSRVNKFSEIMRQIQMNRSPGWVGSPEFAAKEYADAVAAYQKQYPGFQVPTRQEYEMRDPNRAVAQPENVAPEPTPMPMPTEDQFRLGTEAVSQPEPPPVTQVPQMPPTEQQRREQFLVARQRRQQLQLDQERKRVMQMNQQRRRAAVPQVHPGRRPRVSRRQMKQEGKNKLAGWVQKIMQESGIDREQAMWKLYNSSPNAQQVFKALRIRPRRPAGYRPMGSMR